MRHMNLDYELPLAHRLISSAIFVLQHVFNSKTLENIRKKNANSAINFLRQKLKSEGRTLGHKIDIDRINADAESEFVKNYLNKNQPVIFEQAAKDWPCTQKWNLQYLKEHYGDITLPLYESKGLVEKEHDETGDQIEPVLVEEIKARNFVDQIIAGKNKYLRFSLILENYPELINDFNNIWLKRMGKCFLGVGYQTFLGSAQRITPIHAGPTAFLYVMVDGEKKWSLFSAHSAALINPQTAGRVYNFTDVKINNPDPAIYPGFELLSRYEFTLKKGDVLFVPAWMWHEVENLTTSWGMSYRVTSLRCFLRYPSLVFVRLFLTKPFFFKNFIDTFFLKKRTWAKLE